MKRIIQRIQKLHHFLARWWYAPLLGLLSFVDHFIVIFPVDGMLISSILLKKERWFRMTFWTWVGSSLGAILVAVLAAWYGLPFVESFFPDLMNTGFWKWALEFFSHHGLWLLFISGILPLAQQPAAIIVGLAGSPLDRVAMVLFLARGLKFFVLGFISVKAPHVLSKLRSVQAEVREIQELDEKDPSLKNP